MQQFESTLRVYSRRMAFIGRPSAMQQFESTLRMYSHCMASAIYRSYRQPSYASKLA